MQFYPIVEPRHIFWSLSPMFGFALYLAYQRTGRDSRRVLAGFSILLLPLLISRVALIRENLATVRETMDGVAHLEGMSARPEIAGPVRALASQFAALERSAKARPIVIDGPHALPGIWVTDRRNFHPFYIEWTQYKRLPAELELRREFVRANRPWIIVEPPRMAEVAVWQRDFGYEPVGEYGAELGVLLKPPGS
jgi:hypothetical protein